MVKKPFHVTAISGKTSEMSKSGSPKTELCILGNLSENSQVFLSFAEVATCVYSPSQYFKLHLFKL